MQGGPFFRTLNQGDTDFPARLMPQGPPHTIFAFALRCEVRTSLSPSLRCASSQQQQKQPEREARGREREKQEVGQP